MTFKKMVTHFCIAYFTLLGFSSCKAAKYTGPEYERKIYEDIDAFAQKYGNTHHMKLINVGSFPELEPKNTVLFGFWLSGNSRTDLQECRKSFISLVKDFWKMIQDNSLSQECIESANRFRKVKIDLSLDYVGIKIAYWDKNMDRPPLPYIAQAFFYDGKFHYYQADPETQALKLILVEPYDEAIASQTKEIH